MDLDKAYGYDKDKAKDGVWFEIVGAEFLCSYFDPNSPEYRKIIAELTKPVRKLIEFDMLDPDKDRELAAHAFVKSSLKDWRNVYVKGQKIEFSQAAAVKLFTDYPPLFSDVMQQARERSAFALTDADLKN